MASHLRKNGYDIQVIEFIHLLTDEQLEELIDKFVTPETKVYWYGIYDLLATMVSFIDTYNDSATYLKR